MIEWLYHVAEIIVLKCPLQDPLIPVEIPCIHLAFALVYGICYVAVKLWATWRVGVRLDINICTWGGGDLNTGNLVGTWDNPPRQTRR